MGHALFFLSILCATTSILEADINSGCPIWGCLPTGSFSLSAGVPTSNASVKWSHQISDSSMHMLMHSFVGCVSDQVSIVCSTERGYINLDPMTGAERWKTTTMFYPFLPVMDIFGDVIGMDHNQLVYIDRKGNPKQPVDISSLQPHFSAMLTNNSILLVTSSLTNTSQIVALNTEGMTYGAAQLKGSVYGINGTFLPAGHPIIVGFRAYVITSFYPDFEKKELLGTHRLYALDLLNQMEDQIRTAWYIDLHSDSPSNNNCKNFDNPSPTLVYLHGTVYVNFIFSISSDCQLIPGPGILWGIKDNGHSATILFRKAATYGNMVVYDTSDMLSVPEQEATMSQTIWISNAALGVINGYSSKTGDLVSRLNISQLTDITTLTSKLAITRQTSTSLSDVLVFGGTDINGTAHLVAVETELPEHARLLWKTNLSEKDKSEVHSKWSIPGQIVNFAQATPGVNGSFTDWQVGIVAMVQESGLEYSKLYIKAVY